jgi:hypothetical protein
VDEGGTQTITVERVGGSDGPVTVHYVLGSGTAGTEDYEPLAGELTFADGETVKTLTFIPRQDDAVEGNEAVDLILTVPEGSAAELGTPATANLTIVDDDPPLRVEQVVINGGAAQRSNIETIAVRLSRETNLQALIDSGAIASAVKVMSQGGSAVPLSATAFRYDAVARTLTIDVTIDGFGSNRATRLADGRYELWLDTTQITTTGSSPANQLVDDDGTADGACRSSFHRLHGDFDGDRTISSTDIDQLMGHMGKNVPYNWLYDLADATGNRADGAVNNLDLRYIRGRLRKSV